MSQMYKKHVFSILTILMVVLSLTTTVFGETAFNINLSSEADIMIHADTGKILF